MRHVIAAALLGAAVALPAALMPAAAQNAAPDAPAVAHLRTTADLARICAADPSTGQSAHADYGFCYGYGVGALDYHRAVTPANAPPLFCAPSPPPSFESVRGHFVAWVNADPARGAMRPVDGIFAFLRAEFPCPTPPPAPARRR